MDPASGAVISTGAAACPERVLILRSCRAPLFASAVQHARQQYPRARVVALSHRGHGEMLQRAGVDDVVEVPGRLFSVARIPPRTLAGLRRARFAAVVIPQMTPDARAHRNLYWIACAVAPAYVTVIGGDQPPRTVAGDLFRRSLLFSLLGGPEPVPPPEPPLVRPVAQARAELSPPVSLEDVPCNGCGNAAAAIVFTTRDYRFLTDANDFRVVRCTSCGLARVTPRPTASDIHRYYHDEFYRAGETPAQALEAMAPRLRAMARHVNRYARGRLLDVGCFRGEFMEHLRAEHGWSVAGIEFSHRPPNAFGLDIFYGDIADAPYPAASFDVVTVWAVLEHVYDPSHTLRHVHRLLKPGGVAVILVPNFNSIAARVLRFDDVPRHVTMFTRRALAAMLNRCGLRPFDWSCSQDIYSGSVRGLLNLLVKRLCGEPMAEILAQSRLEGGGRWHEFSSCINGRELTAMQRMDAIDNWLAPRLDRLLDTCGLGAIMTVHAKKEQPGA
jgi:hypothetical protein